MRTTSFRQPIARPRTLGPEHNPWFWNPARLGVRLAPEDFRQRLHDLGEELEVTWNPVTERWQVFARTPRIQHPICQGWKLLFVHHLDGAYLPLDERLFARLYAASVLTHGSAKEYFNRIVAEMERDEERKNARQRQDAIDIAMPFWEHSQIKVSMCGESSGSKFSTYHS